MKSFKLFLSIFMLLFVFAACNKYEDGPKFTLLSKKDRLANTWKVDKNIAKNGTITYPNANDKSTMTIEKDGDVIIFNGALSISVNGTWQFINDKESIRISINFIGQSTSSEARILRLKNKELWLRADDGTETHFIPA